MKHLVQFLSLISASITVNCFDDVRLTNIKQNDENIQGEIEIHYREKWRPLCGRLFSINDAIVICRTIGFYKGAAKSTRNALFGLVHKRDYYFLYTGLQCNGNEFSVIKCSNWNKNVMDLKLCPQGIAIAECIR